MPDPRLLSRFGTMCHTKNGAYNGEGLGIQGIFLLVRAIEACWLLGLKPQGRLLTLLTLDPLTKQQAASNLESACGKPNPLRILMEKPVAENFRKLLSAEGADFLPLRKPLLEILAAEELIKYDDLDWRALRQGIDKACKRMAEAAEQLVADPPRGLRHIQEFRRHERSWNPEECQWEGVPESFVDFLETAGGILATPVWCPTRK